MYLIFNFLVCIFISQKKNTSKSAFTFYLAEFLESQTQNIFLIKNNSIFFPESRFFHFRSSLAYEGGLNNINSGRSALNEENVVENNFIKSTRVH